MKILNKDYSTTKSIFSKKIVSKINSEINKACLDKKEFIVYYKWYDSIIYIMRCRNVHFRYDNISNACHMSFTCTKLFSLNLENLNFGIDSVEINTYNLVWKLENIDNLDLDIYYYGIKDYRMLLYCYIRHAIKKRYKSLHNIYDIIRF